MSIKKTFTGILKKDAVSSFRKKIKLGRILPETVRSYKTTIVKWMIIGYLIRLAVMPLFIHGDLINIASMGFLLKETHQLLPSSYPALISYLFAALYVIFDPVLHSHMIFSDITSNTSYTPTTLCYGFRLSEPGIFTFFFVSKLPNLIFDFALALLLLHLIDNEKKGLSALKLWMINPVSLYVSFCVGQFDVIPVFFLTLTLYFFKMKKAEWAMLSLGVTTAFKIFGLLLALPLALIFVKENRSSIARMKKTVKLVGVTLLPLVLVILSSFLIADYYISANAAASGFDINGFFGKTQYDRGRPIHSYFSGLFFYFIDYSSSLATLPGFRDVIYLFPLIYGLFLLGVIHWGDWSFERFWKVTLIFFLVYYSVSLFHTQWFLWAQPLLVLLVVENRKFLKLYLVSIPLYFVYTLYWFSGLEPLMNSIGLPGVQTVNLLRSFLSALLIFTALLILIPERIQNIVKKKYL